MQLIANGSQAGTSPPAPQAAVGTPGYINNQTPGAGVTPTVIDPDVNNAIIAELANVLAAVGIALSPGTFTQIAQAMRRLGACNVTSETSSATLTADNAGLVLVNAAGGNVTLTLPAANGMNGLPMRFAFVRTDNSTNTVTITAAGTDTIQPAGTASITLSGANDAAELTANGTNGWAMPGLSRTRTQNWYATHGTYTLNVPGGYRQARIRCWGAGGGGGGGDASYGGAGGAGGNYAEEIADVAGVASLTVTVGTGGASGSSSGTNGSAGGASSVANGGTTLALANGGGGGFGGASGSSAYGGPAGALGTGTVQMTAGGGSGSAQATGSSAAGGGGTASGGPGTSGGPPSGSPGAGGAGGGVSTAGTAGADGGVLIEFF